MKLLLMLFGINKLQKLQASMITVLTQRKLSVLTKHNAVKTYGRIAL